MNFPDIDQPEEKVEDDGTPTSPIPLLIIINVIICLLCVGLYSEDAELNRLEYKARKAGVTLQQYLDDNDIPMPPMSDKKKQRLAYEEKQRQSAAQRELDADAFLEQQRRIRELIRRREAEKSLDKK